MLHFEKMNEMLYFMYEKVFIFAAIKMVFSIIR